MWNEVFTLAIENGLWAVLFTGLLVFVIRDGAKREQKYQQTIKDLTNHIGVVKDIKQDVDEIKKYIFKDKKSKINSKNNTKDGAFNEK